MGSVVCIPAQVSHCIACGHTALYSLLADIEIEYVSPRGDDLDTRLLRANVIKGILEKITTANVNMVNADLLSEQRGLRIKETTMKGDGDTLLSSMGVSIKASSCNFKGAIDASGKVRVAVCLSSHCASYAGSDLLSCCA